MAKLKDTIISGSLRATDTIYTNNLQSLTFNTYSSSTKTAYGAGTDGQVLKSDGTNTYWGDVTTGVSGVKGNSESSYRTGNVNLTAANIGLGNVENTKLSTWAGSSNITTVGTIGSGTWQGSTVGVGYGGTGATTAANARANLGTWALVSDSYNTLMPANGTTNGWIKIGTANTSFGLLPSQSGNSGSGHNSIGTSAWYWKYAYIDEIYGHLNGTAERATADVDGNTISSTYLKLSTVTTAGDLLYATGNGTISRLAAGTSGYLLQTNGAAAPSWIQATNYATANTIAKRDSSGYLNVGSLYITGSNLMPLQFYNSDMTIRYSGINTYYSSGNDGYLTLFAGSASPNKKYAQLTLESNGNANGLQYYVHNNTNGTATENTYTVLNTGNIGEHIKTYVYTVTWPGSQNSYDLGEPNTFTPEDVLIIGPQSTYSTTVHQAIIKAQFEFSVVLNSNDNSYYLTAWAMGTPPPQGTTISFIVLKCNI